MMTLSEQLARRSAGDFNAVDQHAKVRLNSVFEHTLHAWMGSSLCALAQGMLFLEGSNPLCLDQLCRPTSGGKSCAEGVNR